MDESSLGLKIIFKGPVMNPTGISTANREIVKALDRQGAIIQCEDIFTTEFVDAQGMQKFNKPINAVGASTIFCTYPEKMEGGYGMQVGGILHEGTKLPDHWAPAINKLSKIFVPSKATKNLMRWNGIVIPIKVISYGVNELYKPVEKNAKSDFIFLSVNSWTGELNDRKGTDVLVKAFYEEFKNESNVKLCVKVSTFWQNRPKDFYANRILQIVGEPTDQIMVNEDYLPESFVAELYQQADCFVAPTKGESFGLTILNAKASGLPVVVTKDKNSGHMDFCNDDSTVFIQPSGMAQADPKFFVEGNMQPVITVEELRKSLREAYNNRETLSKNALKRAKEVSEEYSWDNTAKKIIEFMKEDSKW